MKTDEILVSRAVSQRAHEVSKLKKSQQKQMDNKRVEQPSNAFHQSVAATGDTYIAEALRKVRESKVTHNPDLLRMNGTWLYNQTITPTGEK
jgi:hypothetical protein